jgi:hypothetical protein
VNRKKFLQFYVLGPLFFVLVSVLSGMLFSSIADAGRATFGRAQLGDERVLYGDMDLNGNTIFDSTGAVTFADSITVEGLVGSASGWYAIEDEALWIGGNNTPDIKMSDDDTSISLLTPNSGATGVKVKIDHDTSSADDDDIIGYLQFTGRDDEDNEVVGAQVYTKVTDVTNLTEDAITYFDVMIGGNLDNSLALIAGGIGVDETLRLGDADNASNSACISVDSDRLYHDTDCDNTKDGGEEFLDASGVGSGDEVSVDGGATTDPDFVSTGDVDFVNSSNTITGNLNANSVDSAEYVDGSIDHEHLAADIINGMTEVTSADADYILIWDATDSALKKVDMAEVRGGGGGGGTSRLDKELPIQSAKLTGAYTIFTPPSGDACTSGAAIDGGEGMWRLLFDDTTDECATWQFRMPNNYSSDPLLKVGYKASVTADDVEFEAAIMCVSDGENLESASFSNVAVGTATVPGTAGFLDEISITLNDDSCAAGDMVFVVLSTDANDGTNDDATGDREVVYAVLTYTGS